MADERDAIHVAWLAAARAMPYPWRLDSLRYASFGLAPEQRSTEWCAVGVRATSEAIGCGTTPEAALDDLLRLIA